MYRSDKAKGFRIKFNRKKKKLNLKKRKKDKKNISTLKVIIIYVLDRFLEINFSDF